MFPVSDAFKQAIFSTNRKIYVKVTVYWTDNLQATYYGKDLFSLSFLEQKDIESGLLSVGNLSVNQLEIILNNTDRKFDEANEVSPLFGLLKPGRKIEPFMGVDMGTGNIEWVSLGIFWSGEWHSPEEKIRTFVNGIDRLEMLDRSIFESGRILIPPAATIRTDDDTLDWSQGELDRVRATNDGKLILDLAEISR
jgi:hypothetical protein